MKTREHGFTVIELVVVIAILGILAAVALPRFAGLTNDAYEAKLEGTMGGFASAVVIAHSAWLVRGTPNTTINLEGTVVEMDGTTGWPALTATQNATQLYNNLMSTTLDSAFAAVAATGDLTATYTLGAYTAGDNVIQYIPAMGAVSIVP